MIPFVNGGGGGPILSLTLWGWICPCFEKEESKSARHSLQQFNRLGARVDWHTSPSRKSTPTAAGFVQSLFGRSSSNIGIGIGGSTTQSSSSLSSKTHHHADDKPPTPVRMRVVDAIKESINYGEPYPELQLQPLPTTQEDEGEDVEKMAVTTTTSSMTMSPNGNKNGSGVGGVGGGLSGLMKQNAMSYQLDIPLHHILRVESIDPTMFVIITKDVQNSTDDKTIVEKEAARVSFTSSDDRDAASLDLMVLVEWNKHRQPTIEEELPALGIRQRAQKAAHFAKREIEMREKKRDREKRKASHMEGSKGLKYTAMAMANQQSSN